MAVIVWMKVGVVVVVLLASAAAAAADQEGAHGKEYEVRWEIPTEDTAYYSAIQGKTYYVGDTLKFTYIQEMHNVVEVGSFDDFDNCTMSTQLGPEHADGTTSLTLDTPGVHYFICSIPGHCTDGMKIKVVAITPPIPL